MILFKRIEINLEAERARIARVGLNKRQRAALTKVVDLFEQGKFQQCLDHIQDKKAFPYNRRGEYPEQEHVGIEIGDALRDMAHSNYYTQAELMKQALEHDAKQKAEARAKQCPICHDSRHIMQATGSKDFPLKAVPCACQRKKKSTKTPL